VFVVCKPCINKFVNEIVFKKRDLTKSNSQDIKRSNFSWVPVAHAYNPSYSEGRDKEDGSSKPAQV
jgi:hypothetical protein